MKTTFRVYTPCRKIMEVPRTTSVLFCPHCGQEHHYYELKVLGDAQ